MRRVRVVVGGTTFVVVVTTLVAGCLAPPDPVIAEDCAVLVDDVPAHMEPGAVRIRLTVQCGAGVALQERGLVHRSDPAPHPTRAAYDAACAQEAEDQQNLFDCAFDEVDVRYVRGYQLFTDGGVAKIAWSKEYVVTVLPPGDGPPGHEPEVRLWNVPARPVHDMPFTVTVSVDPPPGASGAAVGEFRVFALAPGTAREDVVESAGPCGAAVGLVPGAENVRCVIGAEGPHDLFAHATVPVEHGPAPDASRAVPVQVR